MTKLPERRIILAAHNLRSCHNVGSLLRTSEGLGVERVILSGYTPAPAGRPDDDRLPHIAAKIDLQIHKSALGAEAMVAWHKSDDILTEIEELRTDGWQIAALEQSPYSTLLPGFTPPDKLVIIVGREVEGIEPEILQKVDITLEIPMAGRKESFNVAQAAAMSLYHCRFANNS